MPPPEKHSVFLSDNYCCTKTTIDMNIRPTNRDNLNFAANPTSNIVVNSRSLLHVPRYRVFVRGVSRGRISLNPNHGICMQNLDMST